jgi:hypothetical protein
MPGGRRERIPPGVRSFRMNFDHIARQLVTRAQEACRLRIWPTGAPHEGALRVALSSAISMAARLAERGDAAWRQALDDVLARDDVARLQALLTGKLAQIQQAGAVSTLAVMHLRIAAVALVRGDREEARARFLAALSLERGDQIAALGAVHLPERG